MEARHDVGLWPESRHRVRCIGVMGGTSDLIHHGYLVAASEIQTTFGLDEIVLVPTFMQLFKLGRAVIPAEHHYLIVVTATASDPKFSVSRVDIEHGTITYTIDTLRGLHGIYQNSELFFTTETDAIAGIMRWKDIDKLFELAYFVGVARPGVVSDSGSLPTQRVFLVEVPAMAINSTDCRPKVKLHQPVWYLVSDGVMQYIAKYGPYQDSGSLVSSAGTAKDYKSAGILKFREGTPK